MKWSSRTRMQFGYLTAEDLDAMPPNTIICADYSVARKTEAGEWWMTDHAGAIDPLRMLLSDENWSILRWGVGRG